MSEGEFQPSFNPLNLEAQHQVSSNPFRHTKIVYTLYPHETDVNRLLQLIDAGVNILRVNLSYGKLKEHYKMMRLIKEINRLRPEKPCGIMVSTKGPRLRTGLLRNHEPLTFAEGDELTLVPDSSVEGHDSTITCEIENLTGLVKPGDTIAFDHGRVACEVTQVTTRIQTRVKVGGVIGENKSIHLFGMSTGLPSVTDKDEDDILNFVLKYNIDYISVTCVNSSRDVEMVRQMLSDKGAHLKVISKIQTQEALTNFESIVDASDGIIIQRADLDLIVPPEKLYVAQKLMIQRCILFGKLVIISGGVLEGTTQADRVSDIADISYCIKDGVDGFIVAGAKTSMDSLQAVEIVSGLCMNLEPAIDLRNIAGEVHATPVRTSCIGSLCYSAIKVATLNRVKLILAPTDTGYTALQLSKYRTYFPIIAISTNQSTLGQMNLVRSCFPFKIQEFRDLEHVLQVVIEHAKQQQLVGYHDKVLVVYSKLELESDEEGIMKIITVE